MSEHKFQQRDIVEHCNGGRYRVVGLERPVAEESPFYIYYSVKHGDLRIRSVSEMEDGRFTLIFRPQASEAEE